MPPIDSYVAYYKRFGYTYHVLSQFESVVGERNFPRGLCWFRVHVHGGTQEHAFDRRARHAKACAAVLHKSRYGRGKLYCHRRQTGKECAGRHDDRRFGIRDSSILRGPDDKSRIDSDTKSALFTVYAPKGIGEESIMSHLDDLYTYIRLFSAQAAASCVKIRPPMHA